MEGLGEGWGGGEEGCNHSLPPVLEKLGEVQHPPPLGAQDTGPLLGGKGEWDGYCSERDMDNEVGPYVIQKKYTFTILKGIISHETFG
jgi:hypothetical protein